MTNKTKKRIWFGLLICAAIVIVMPKSNPIDENVQFRDKIRIVVDSATTQKSPNYDICTLKTVECGEYTEMYSFITGFNTVPEQTDDKPCDAKYGYICGRDDVTACPRSIEAHTIVDIWGKRYECMDWTAEKYNGRFDISCDKDMDCPARMTGWTTVKIYSNN